MKKHKKFIIAASVAAAVIAALFTAIILTAGGDADVIKKYSRASFEKIYETCESQGYIAGNADNFTLGIDDGARFIKDGENVAISVDLQPYADAGLNLDLLPEEYKIQDGVLSFAEAYSRTKLGFHSAMGHFGITFNGGSFEWAQDILSNDKDIVFGLLPQPFIDAGVDPEKVEGWSYGEVEMHKDGKTVKEFMFLKAYNLA